VRASKSFFCGPADSCFWGRIGVPYHVPGPVPAGSVKCVFETASSALLMKISCTAQWDRAKRCRWPMSRRPAAQKLDRPKKERRRCARSALVLARCRRRIPPCTAGAQVLPSQRLRDRPRLGRSRFRGSWSGHAGRGRPVAAIAHDFPCQGLSMVRMLPSCRPRLWPIQAFARVFWVFG
jgi:hypothetical protein